MVSFGRSRRVIPNRNRGQEHVAQRRIAEVAGRAAESSRAAIAVDCWTARVYLRNLRPVLPCPCTMYSGAGRESPEGPDGLARVTVDGGEYDDVGGIDAGYPRGTENQRAPGTDLPAVNGAGTPPDEVNLMVQRLLAGNGRRCGICWGTGFLDGHRLWGGARRVLCIQETPGTSQVGGDADVDLESTTPTMLGPGQVTWAVRINEADCILDGLRLRDGLLPADPTGLALEVSLDGGTTWQAPGYGLAPNRPAAARSILTGDMLFRLTLAEGSRCSHVEIVSRSEPLLRVQLPQLTQAASVDLIAPFLEEDFEIDPIVGSVERGTILDVEPRNGSLGMLWLVTSVTNKRTADNFVFNVSGQARNAQPTDTWACASLTDAVRSGLLDPGTSTRGLESTGGGAAAGLEGRTDESAAAARRGTSRRLGGGSDEGRPVVVLSSGDLE